jgi:hypothetical protein
MIYDVCVGKHWQAAMTAAEAFGVDFTSETFDGGNAAGLLRCTI